FPSYQINGTTVAGTGAIGTINLDCPNGLVLDADGYMFIADCGNHRIVASEPNGFRCLVGYSASSGLASNQLYNPTAINFDTDGNILTREKLSEQHDGNCTSVSFRKYPLYIDSSYFIKTRFSDN
ncbi:unnamed protein product, partial [Rotaria sp. Silwood2]